MKSLQLSVVLLLATACVQAAGTPASAGLRLDGLSGPVTQDEIEAFKSYLRTRKPPETPWGAHHNAWAFYEGGPALESLDMMYEITGDIDFLNQAIGWADKCLSERNDLLPAEKGGQRVMWTGQVEKVWCPEGPSDRNAKYSGCETEDGIEHVIYCAKLILKHPELANVPVPGGDPFGYGSTYLKRAKTYLFRCDESNDSYFLKWFIQPGTHLIRDPENQPAWAKMHNNLNAINRQMMFDGGFQRLAECHEILGDDPARVKAYDSIVRASMGECLPAMRKYASKMVNGHLTYDWSYFPWSTQGSESVGHAAYDVVGIYRAYFRRDYEVPYADVAPIANTMAYVIAKGGDSFAATVDGKGTIRAFGFGEWVLMADWNPDVLGVIGQPVLASGRYRTDPWLTACILWIKDRRAHGVSPITPSP